MIGSTQLQHFYKAQMGFYKNIPNIETDLYSFLKHDIRKDALETWHKKIHVRRFK